MYHLLVIDYEVGAARVFIEKQFRLYDPIVVGLESGLYIAAHARHSNIYALIFDPRIEEFLKEHLSVDVERYKREVKSVRACEVLGPFLERDSARRVIGLVAGKIRLLLRVG